MSLIKTLLSSSLFLFIYFQQAEEEAKRKEDQEKEELEKERNKPSIPIRTVIGAWCNLTPIILFVFFSVYNTKLVTLLSRWNNR